ncbi:MAG: pilus assembly protein TadG-related protein, partial [Actinobacteria bacterium]|nr:pilus assembly protein TadG-related protein [Actinomycetota bacterium]
MTKLWMPRPRRSDERGAILIMATVGIVLAIIASALAVDLGRIAQERRSDQRVADLAALDAARDLANTDARAQASADRNKFPWSKPGYSLSTAVGSLDANRVFHAGVGSSAVEVTVKSPLKNTFVSGSRTITTRAVATVENQGEFSIGSSLASLDPSKTVLNQFMGQWIQASGPVNVVSYDGLASANVTLGALQQQLVAAGLDVGSVDKLLNTNITMQQLLKASAQALGPSNPAASADLNGLALAANGGMTVKLGDMINVAQGSGDAALSGTVNVFRLVTGSAAIANGTNTVNIPSMNVTIPG